VPVRGSPTNGPDGLPEIRRAEGGNVGREGKRSQGFEGIFGGPAAGAAQRHIHGWDWAPTGAQLG
jgi:hypothetical protein